MNKVAFVIGSMGDGGAERVISILSSNFAKRGIKTVIITIYSAQQSYQINKDVFLRTTDNKSVNRVLRVIKRIISLRKMIREENPDVIISFLADVNIYTLIACAGLHIPIVVSERNDPAQDPKSKQVRYLRDKAYKYAKGIVFQTPDAQLYFKGKIPSNRETVIIPNPIKTDLPTYDSTSSATSIISACRLSKQKNIPMMINAVQAIIESGYKCTLTVYGEGPLRKDLENIVLNKGLEQRIQFPGFCCNIHEKMQHAALFVISSDYEGISNSMLEALAIGVPVIATDCPVGGAKMYIKNGENGWLVPVGDVAALQYAIEDAICNRNKAIQMGQNAMKIRSELSADIIMDKWLSFLKAVTGMD